MRRIEKKTRQITAVVSVAAAIILTLLLFFFRTRDAMAFSNELFLAAILIAIVPSAVLDLENQRWTDAIDDQMPLFVRGISESQETGTTLIGSIENTVKNNVVHRPLSDEINRLTVQMSWGLSFEAALNNFRQRVASPVVTRFSALVLEASRSGGEIRKVFTATSGFMDDMREMDRETDSQMKPYLLIVYVAFYVFIFTSIILLMSFFKPLQGFQQILSPLTVVGISDFKDFFYRTMIISGLMGGLMAGKIGERRVPGGLKHAIIMVISGYIVFYFMIPPNWMVI